MSWRAYLVERPIRSVDILAGKPSLLAVWLRSDQVTFLDLQTGVTRGEITIAKPPQERSGDAWQTFLNSLKAPNDVMLPVAKAGSLTLLNSPNGQFRVLRTGTASLSYYADAKETPLELKEGVTDLAAIDVDRSFGLVAALDTAGTLHLFQQQLYVGSYPTGLTIEPELRPDLTITGNGASVFVSNGKQIAVYNAAGKLKRKLDIHYTMGMMRPSSNGKVVVTTDLDNSVVRIYHGETFALMYQRFAVDLIAEARRIVITPGPAFPAGAIGSIAVNTRGVLAFTVGGVVCVTSVSRFKPLPGFLSDDGSDEVKPIKPNGEKTVPDQTLPSASAR